MKTGAKFNLLVATDFSSRADNALDYATALARREAYELFVLHVFNPEIQTYPGQEELAYGNARRMLEKTIDSYSSKYLIEINGLLEQGNIFSTINETARKINADMLVMPVHQMMGIQNLIGRFAFRIIAACPVPVMVIQQPMDFRGFDRVLVPLDLMQTVDENVEKAIQFGSQHNSTIVLFSVASVESYISSLILKKEMGIVKNRVERHGLQCETHIIMKPLLPVYRHILDFSRKINADAILMMARREDDHDKLFVGGTAGRVIGEATVPVIVNAPSGNPQVPKIIPALFKKLVKQG